MIHCFFLISRHGRSRLTKWYSNNLTQSQKQIMLKEVNQLVITRAPRMCNFLHFKNYKIVYKRYAALYFIAIVDQDQNQLIILQLMQSFVEILDRYFGNVCELDLIFNFQRAYSVLDEILIAGSIGESSKHLISKELQAQKILLEEKEEASNK